MTTCRLCNTALSRVVVDLGMSPLSNAFLRADQLAHVEAFYPLRVFVCERCWLVQLPEAERAENIFKQDYVYFSGYSDSWLRHCEDYAKAMIERFRLDARSLVVEIASNDGYLLQYFKRAGVGVLGVEPSQSVANVAVERGIPTEVRFFGATTGKAIRASGRSANLMAANNVLAHVPDLHDFLEGFREVLAPDGVITFEFPHLFNLIQLVQFDTIYQEHYSYLSLHVVQAALSRHGLAVFDVDELSTHGGSLRVYAHHQKDGRSVSERVGQVLERERVMGLQSAAGYAGFQEKTDRVKHDLLAFLIDAKRAGKRVVGYGAPAKGNTLLNYSGIRRDLLAFTVDRSPHKQGLFLPGTHIPVLAPEQLDAAKPDFVLVLPWNLKSEITTQLAHIRGWGGRFVFAIPALEVVA